jgi:uncharacterized damage-inducible protein DinB
MSEGLLDPFRHNAWATRRLLAFCRDLPREVLTASVPGTFGGILDTLHHLVDAETRYCYYLLTGQRLDPSALPEDAAVVAALEEQARALEGMWEQLLSAPVDSERIIITRDAYQVRAGIVLVQTLNHGNEHRAQVCTTLGALGHEPPDIDGWPAGGPAGGPRRHPAR